MRSIFAFPLLFFSSFAAGFSPDTIVLDSQGFIPIGQLQKASCVNSYDLTRNAIVQVATTNYRTYTSSLACKVICDNDISFIASPDQIVRTGDSWCAVKDLKPHDRLWCYQNAYVIVEEIKIITQETELIEISVVPAHTFFVTSAQILVHNHPAIIVTVAPLVTSMIPVAAKAVGILGVAGAALYSLFAKNAGHSISKNSINSSSSCSAPPLPPDDDDEFRKKHPHGRYEDIGYHKNYQSGQKGPRPINGQEALDNSFSLGDSTFRRIGVSNRQFVVLDRTREGLYHGHVRTWDQLRQVMKNILEKQGIVTGKGKFI